MLRNPLATCALAFLISLGVAIGVHAQSNTLKVGDKAPMIQVDETIQGELTKAGQPYVLEFWATWCGPCKSYGPIIEGFAKDNESRSDLHIRKINVDENPVMAQKHGIRSIPTTIIFKDGQLITKVPGVIQKNKLNEFVGNLS